MQIAMSKTREQFPLSVKKIVKKTVTGAVGLMVLFYFISIFLMPFIFPLLLMKSTSFFLPFSFSGLPALMFLALFLLFFICIILLYFYQRWYFAVYFYDLTDDHVIIRKGPITPSEITFSYERVQDVYVDQDLFDRIFGLYDVHLSTATATSGMEAHIDGLEKEAADGLRDVLLRKVQEKISKNKS